MNWTLLIAGKACRCDNIIDVTIPTIFKREISVRWNVLMYCGGNTFSAQLPKTCPYSHTLRPRRTLSSGTKPGSTYRAWMVRSQGRMRVTLPEGGRAAGFPLCKQVVRRPQAKQRTASSIFAHAPGAAGTVRFNMKFLVNFTASLSTPIAITTIWHAQSPCYPVQEEVGTLATITMGKRKNCPCA